MDVSKGKTLYEATRRFRFSNAPPLDILDRLSLVTVKAGLRRMGVLEGDGLELEPIRDVVISHGIPTSVGKHAWFQPQIASKEPHSDLIGVLHSLGEHSPSTPPRRVLWACGSPENRQLVKGKALSKFQVGMLLGYPECCVNDQIEANRRVDRLFIEALVRKVGDDKEAITRALRDNVSVEMEDFPCNASITTTAFPFLMHVSCDGCLASPQSPSARLNEQYAELVHEVDAAWYEAIKRVGELMRQLQSCVSTEEKDAIFQEISEVHSQLFSRGKR